MAAAVTRRFGPFVLDADAYRLTRDGVPIALSPKALDLLFLFADRPGTLLTKDAIFTELWPDVTVTDNALTQVVSEIREALEDQPASPKFVETVPRRGYRFVAVVETPPAPGPPMPARVQPRETSSLEAYRAVTEGRLKLEALDPAEVPAALAHFERAIALDPGYAAAYVGRAHASFWRFQESRLSLQPNRDALDRAVGDARRAVEIDPELAEGHAALALFLAAAGRPREAVMAGRVATGLEPANWRHQFRLGTAAWGDERLQCFAHVLAACPPLAYAHFGTAMVHVARGDLATATRTLQNGIAHEPERQGDARFQGPGLHWLLGLIQLASGDPAGATAEFDRELARATRGLHASEFAMDAYDGHGFARLAAGDATGAVEMFTRALALYPEHARSLVGLAAAQGRAGDAAAAAASLTRARAAIAELATQDHRRADAALAAAFAHVVARKPGDALAILDTLLTQAPPGPAGWTMPIEPLLFDLRQQPAFEGLLARLATRAR